MHCPPVHLGTVKPTWVGNSQVKLRLPDHQGLVWIRIPETDLPHFSGTLNQIGFLIQAPGTKSPGVLGCTKLKIPGREGIIMWHPGAKERGLLPAPVPFFPSIKYYARPYARFINFTVFFFQPVPMLTYAQYLWCCQKKKIRCGLIISDLKVKCNFFWF